MQRDARPEGPTGKVRGMTDMEFCDKTALITGGAGFIGSHVCQALLHTGWDVAAVDNFDRYYDPRYKRENVEEIRKTALLTGRRFTLYEGDIRDLPFLDGAFGDASPCAALHLAACAGVRPSIEAPALYTEVNVNGTVNVLECLKKHGVKRFLYASSSSVYGNNRKVPFSESDAVDHPISPYAASKKAGELLCHVYHHLYGISMACLRFFTVYGPRQRPDLAIYKFAQYISEGRPIPFYGDGSTKRDYTFVGDITGGVMRAMDWVGTGNRYDIFNLGESHTVSLGELVETIERALGKKAILDRKPMQAGDVYATFADTAHAKEVLGYAPETDFETGIRIFIDWFREYRLRDILRVDSEKWSRV